MIYEEKDIAVLAVGSMVKTAEKVYAQLKLEGRFCTLVNARFVKPVDAVSYTHLDVYKRQILPMSLSARLE